jgi:abortive infection bacteriophage resistance protein
VKPPYTKPWLSLADQLTRLERGGMTIADRSAASTFLRHLNYYRFSGYALAFETSRHCYVPGTTFEQIRQAYGFDRSLRDLIADAMEVIELDVRTSVAYHFGQSHGAFGHTQASHFFPRFDHRRWLADLHRETDRSSERFIGHFKTRYREYPDIPLWVATEIMSFGTLSRMIQGMWKGDQKAVAHRYGLQPAVLTSALHHLVYVRNLCAHHARLWDREWTIKPTLPPGKNWAPPLLPGNDRLFASLLVQATFLKGCATERAFSHDWRLRLEDLVRNHAPACPHPDQQMGLTPRWTQHPLWAQL